MTDPDIPYKKLQKKHTVNDLMEIDTIYQKMDLLWSEMNDHDLNGRIKESNRLLKEIYNLNREINIIENRCRVRIGLKKL